MPFVADGVVDVEKELQQPRYDDEDASPFAPVVIVVAEKSEGRRHVRPDVDYIQDTREDIYSIATFPHVVSVLWLESH